MDDTKNVINPFTIQCLAHHPPLLQKVLVKGAELVEKAVFGSRDHVREGIAT
jgi:hypothetical protein